jgi:hypothetical protein
MAARLRIYLAGPITGCNDDQKTWWRDEVKLKLGKQFDFEDPTDWADDRAVSREIAKLEVCDVVLANMWKESVGTILGIVRASQQGKPVVLVDQNRIHNSTLNALVHPETPVHSLDDACARIRELAAEWRPVYVVKKDGEFEPFDGKKVARSVTAACAAANVTDAALEEQVTGPVIAQLRREGGQRGSLATEEIRGAILSRLKYMQSDLPLPADVRSRCDEIVSAWELHEKVTAIESTIRDYEDRITSAREEIQSWKAVVRGLERTEVVHPPSAGDDTPQQGPRFRSMNEVLKSIDRKWSTFLVVHDDAKSSGRKIRPTLTARGLEQLHDLLEQLGDFARNRAFAEVDGRTPPDLTETFGDAYAPTESGETKDRYRKDFYDYKGRKYRGLQHLKMTDDQGSRIRVYFDEISRAQFLVCEIGHRETFRHDG